MSKLAKCTTWFLRLFQHFFALILIGITAYMTHEFKSFHYNIPQEVFIPLLFSVLALFVSFWSLLAICCLGHHLQVVAAFLDFAILSGFITSAVLLHDSFHIDNAGNRLRNWLIYVRIKNGETPRDIRTGALVKALDAGVVLMIVLFFFTTLLSFYVALDSFHEDQKVRDLETARNTRFSGGGQHSTMQHHHEPLSTSDGYDTYDTTESSYISEVRPSHQQRPRH